MLTGPWMSYFYSSTRHHLEDVLLIKKVISVLKECIATPIKILRLEVDFFGNPLDLNDHIISNLRRIDTTSRFIEMIKVCLEGSVNVIESQYKHYFDMDITDDLMKTSRSVRSSNIAAERCMGIFSEILEKSPNCTVPYSNACLLLKTNNILSDLKLLNEKSRNIIISKSINISLKIVKNDIQYNKDVFNIKSMRDNERVQVCKNKKRRKLDKSIKSINNITVFLNENYPSLNEQLKNTVFNIFNGDVVGSSIKHTWNENNLSHIYSGKILTYKNDKYSISYKLRDDTEMSYIFTKWQLVSDVIEGDCIFSELVITSPQLQTIPIPTELTDNQMRKTSRKRKPNSKYDG